MKKTIKTIIALVLCFCMVMPISAFAAAEEEQVQEQEVYSSVEEYIASSQEDVDDSVKTKITLAKFLNRLSNVVINGILGAALNFIIPDSAAVADYEEFKLEDYENFYAGMEEFIDEPQGDKVWSLGMVRHLFFLLILARRSMQRVHTFRMFSVTKCMLMKKTARKKTLWQEQSLWMTAQAEVR